VILAIVLIWIVMMAVLIKGGNTSEYTQEDPSQLEQPPVGETGPAEGEMVEQDPPLQPEK